MTNKWDYKIQKQKGKQSKKAWKRSTSGRNQRALNKQARRDRVKANKEWKRSDTRYQRRKERRKNFGKVLKGAYNAVGGDDLVKTAMIKAF